MTLRSTILVACLSAFGCSSSRTNRDSGTTDGGTLEVEPGDIVSGDAGSNDTGAGDPDSAPNDSGANPQPLCDGVEHLRLWVFIAPGDELRASTVRVENGFPFIAIDGTCSYWVGGGWAEDAVSRDRPIRTGKLTDPDVASLQQAVPLGDIAALGDCPPPPPGLFDYSNRVIRTAMAEVACFTGAPSLTAGTRFEAAWPTLQTIASRLWNDGTPMTGALHVSAADASSGTSTPAAYAWPIASPLASFVLPSADWFMAGVSHLVDDPIATGQLRALRDQYLTDRTAQPGLYVSWDGLEATDQTSTGYVYMRDAIPYEDAQGLLRF